MCDASFVWRSEDSFQESLLSFHHKGAPLHAKPPHQTCEAFFFFFKVEEKHRL